MSTTALEPTTWTALISPVVSWLDVSPDFGAIAAASSPVTVTMAATRPVVCGNYNTAVTFNGTNSLGQVLVTKSLAVDLNYSANSTHDLYLRLTRKDYSR